MPQLARTCDAALGLADALLRVGIAETGVALEYNDLSVNQLRIRQGFFDGGRTYEALVRAYAETGVVLRP